MLNVLTKQGAFIMEMSLSNFTLTLVNVDDYDCE